ncbi:MAG: flavodoxin family protein, partial [Pseudomonadota bacterium]
MKIFAINGSPNMKQGMTHKLLEIFLDGAREAGAEIDYVFLQKEKIEYCLGCFSCWLKHPGRCVHKDDMPGLLERFKGSKYFVIGTPLYVDGMTAQTKTFIDRLICMGDPHFEMVDGHFRHLKTHGGLAPELVLVSVCGFYERDNFDGLIDHVRRMSLNMQTRFVGAVVRPTSYVLSMDELLPEVVKKIKEAARKAGRELVEIGSFRPETLEVISKEDYFPKDVSMEMANKFMDQCI